MTRVRDYLRSQFKLMDSVDWLMFSMSLLLLIVPASIVLLGGQ